MDDTVNTTRENAGHDQLLNVKKGNGGKQLKGNLIEVTRSLHAMFDAENTKECNQPNEILMILSKRGRKEEHDDMDNLTRCMKGLKILAKDHLPMGDDPNIIQGLKNAGTTYQRLIDSIFAKQIGRNIKVYVDDMVIKSPDDKKLLEDVEETFKMLEKVKMKLNPRKCTFGVEEDQFLWYYITTKGIQSPTKVDELMEVPSPHTLRDAQG
ncbi:uncharacterized protein LOC111881373 [Lactuca sativa]|uniref:uncharacterized protein LOC111881373 n=1 Tax=Lactuca sativa TaxID=4236 RepID=UPI000CD911E3|nr:uncharacterized protein LOC111881373 [Lactuca sativa]